MSEINLEELFRSLMTFEIMNDQPVAEALEQIGILIDVSTDLRRSEGTKRGLDLAQQCLERSPTPEETALLHYFSANAWSHLHAEVQKSNSICNWEQPEIEKQLIHLRRALNGVGFKLLPEIRQCQIATNFGNLFSHVGRFVEAIEYWNRALRVDPNFSMALANRGRGQIEYARALYDEGHQPVFLRQAHIDLCAGLAQGLDPAVVQTFEQMKLFIEQCVNEEYLRTGTDMEGFSLGDSDDEQRYRHWCLDQQLFLNPLNDLGPFSIASHDVFTVPSIILGTGEGPTYHGFFNQIKQEFVSARFMFYEAITADKTHFADKGVLLYNTFDYPAYSLAIEKVKIAFRMAYSLFDKVAFFLNDYLKLGIPEKKVTFRTVWYEKQDKKKGLIPQFQRCENWPLQGLFWLSKDLFEDAPGFQETIEPDAQELNELRNHVEHKYLKLHETCSPQSSAKTQTNRLGDRLAYSVGRHDFEAKTRRILKRIRAGLIYLSLGVHFEEKRRRLERGNGRITPQLSLDTWNDEWKV